MQISWIATGEVLMCTNVGANASSALGVCRANVDGATSLSDTTKRLVKQVSSNNKLERTRMDKVQRLLPTLAALAPVRWRPESRQLAAQLER